MMGNRIRSRKDRTGLAVISPAVGKEERVFRGIMLCKHTPLSDKTLVDKGRFGDNGAGAYNKMFHYNTGSYVYRILIAAVNGSLIKAYGTFYSGGWTDPHIAYDPAVENA